jgi:hypothetical protein
MHLRKLMFYPYKVGSSSFCAYTKAKPRLQSKAFPSMLDVLVASSDIDKGIA